MINTYIPYFIKKDQNILSKCLETNFVSTAGPLVKKFENQFKSKYKFKYSLALNSGTSALHVALKSIGVKDGDTVILPSYTFAATANAVIYNNAKPWFFDCDENFNLPIEKIENTLKKKTYFKGDKLIIKKNNSIVRAIMPVSTFGKKLNFDDLIKFSKKYNIKLLFDTAASHDPKIFNFKKNDRANFCFSFNGNKTITTGAGGMFASNSKKVFLKAKTLANVGKRNKKYDYEEIGFNYKMTNIQASLGLSQFKNLNKILSIKKKIFSNYFKYFKNIKNIRCIFNKKYQNWVFVIIVKSNIKFKKTKKLFDDAGIQLDYFWKPLHMQKPYKKFMKEKLNLTEYIWNKILVLPSHPGLKPQEQMKVIKIIKKLHDQ